jgi:hypothetical protein
MEIKGKIIKILPVENGFSKSGNMWQKNSIIVGNDAFFGTPICFSMFGSAIDLSLLTIGKSILVDFEIESKENNGKWYNNITVYSLKILDEKEAITETIIFNNRPDFKFVL